MWPSKIKAIAGITVVLLILVTVAYFSNNQQYLFWISLISGLVQIVLFIAWYFEENPGVPQRTLNQVQEIYVYTQEEKTKNSKKEELIKQLLKEGVIEEQELRTALSKIQNDEIILVHTYGEGTPENLKKEMKSKSTPAMGILMNLGFVRVFGQHNLFLIPSKDLPKSLRNIRSLEQFLKSEIERIWKALREKTIKQFPATQYKIMEKWRSGEGYKVSYIISKAPKNDIIAGFKNRYSFTPEFVAVIFRRLSLGHALPRIRNTTKLVEVVKRMSIELFLTDFPQSLKEGILNDEKAFKDALGVKMITDLRNVQAEKINTKLQEIDPTQVNCDNYSQELIDDAKEFYELLVTLGADI